jgi:hypothetical protein
MGAARPLAFGRHIGHTGNRLPPAFREYRDG